MGKIISYEDGLGKAQSVIGLTDTEVEALDKERQDELDMNSETPVQTEVLKLVDTILIVLKEKKDLTKKLTDAISEHQDTLAIDQIKNGVRKALQSWEKGTENVRELRYEVSASDWEALEKQYQTLNAKLANNTPVLMNAYENDRLESFISSLTGRGAMVMRDIDLYRENQDFLEWITRFLPPTMTIVK